eukprot:CAMPEP_0201692678 /NCGR_PEP_ID=MMETSP0578-20130828/5500_1 /ASSEMBLY_ACC=CAM_ASM_000663 /TAXON_ID=267565 /ORGANISM="Skeletonema grethea, Strain CCMP 1804" /LENGTH=538 /DNA_ID=CAMNT_0048178089 /DNA_START=108 /DNA_END=1724 /DNA_ORIENTATION=+
MSEIEASTGQSAESFFYPIDESSGLSDELFECCKSDISEDGLREIIIQRHQLMPNSHVVDDYQFFRIACQNEGITEGIIQCLLEYFPDAASATDDVCEQVALHYTCGNKNATVGIIQLLIDAAPDSVRSVDDIDYTPLHYLCDNGVGELAAIEILKLLIEKFPEAVRHEDSNGRLPIHHASGWRSPEFCRLLIEAYPGSERIATTKGALSLHFACATNSLETVQYFYHLHSHAIDHKTRDGQCPIHHAITGTKERDNPTNGVEIVRFLLDCDHDQKLKQYRGRASLLLFACVLEYNEPNLHASVEIIKVLYDAQPEAIEDNKIASNIHRCHAHVQAFINGELVYAHQAKDFGLMTTPDVNGRLPLHRALQDNVRLGSIKLLVKGNPSAIRSSDDNGITPLHVACQHHDSSSVVKYLVDLSTNNRILKAVDYENNAALHYACLGAKYGTISLLLESYDAVSVSKRNAHKKFPIHLLWESNQVTDRESIDYTQSIFQLLRAYPDIVNCDVDVDDKVRMVGDSLSLFRQSKSNEKKRKLVA